MLQKIAYGTFIFFGLLTTGGGIFVWFGVPETKRLTLEEMDILFGSRGVAEGDKERMRAINKEIGLEDALARIGMDVGAGDAGDRKQERSGSDGVDSSGSDGDEKTGLGGGKAEQIETVR